MIKFDNLTTWQLNNLTNWQPDNLTLLSIDMKTKVVQHDNYHDDYYDYHDNYHDDYHNENHDYRDDYHDAWTLNLSHLVHLWKHCFPCLSIVRICCLISWMYRNFLPNTIYFLPSLLNISWLHQGKYPGYILGISWVPIKKRIWEYFDISWYVPWYFLVNQRRFLTNLANLRYFLDTTTNISWVLPWGGN